MTTLLRISLEPHSCIAARNFPGQGHIQHGDEHDRCSQGQSRKRAKPRLAQLARGACLVRRRELVGEHLKAVLDDGLV